MYMKASIRKIMTCAKHFSSHGDGVVHLDAIIPKSRDSDSQTISFR
jgi:hypothetical protein